MARLTFFRGGAGGGNYPYVTARVRAKKPKLIASEEYPKLLAMSPAEIARYLEEGEYKSQVLALAGRYNGALLVEAATRLNLSEEFREIQSFASGELARVLSLLLQRWDIYNVKTILRGRSAGVSDDEITRNLIPAGALSVADLEGLLRLGNLNEVVEALRKTPYGSALGEGGAAVGSLAEIENALDERYYELLFAGILPKGEANRALLQYLRTEVDVLNLKTVLRLRVEGVDDAGSLLLAGGRSFDIDSARRLMRMNVEEFLGEIERSQLKDALPALRATLEKGDLNAAVTALDNLLLDQATSFSHRYPLSALPVIDYLLRKKTEVDNLRIIAYLKSRGVSERKLEELVRR